mgnify:CR=1 FL=1
MAISITKAMGERKYSDGGSDFVANTNVGFKNQHCDGNGKPPFSGGKPFNLEAMLNDPCPKHTYPNKPSTHGWKDFYIMREFRNQSLQQHHGNNNCLRSG